VLVVIWLFLKKVTGSPAPLPEAGALEIDDPELEKYNWNQIEKDLAKLE